MAKRKKKVEEAGGAPMWMVTFSDLMTLLLTFFVLLLSMSSMDRTILTKINTFTNDLSLMTYKGSGRIPSRIRLLLDLIENPLDVMEKPNRVKDLLFPDDMIPEGIDKSTLMENLAVLARPEGVALVLSDGLLFGPGSWELTEPAKKLLGRIKTMLQYTAADINVAGYTDSSPARDLDNYELSGKRALSVTDFFVRGGLRESRFSVSGYADHWPLPAPMDPLTGKPNQDLDVQAMNRRVEILLRTEPWFGRY